MLVEHPGVLVEVRDYQLEGALVSVSVARGRVWRGRAGVRDASYLDDTAIGNVSINGGSPRKNIGNEGCCM